MDQHSFEFQNLFESSSDRASQSPEMSDAFSGFFVDFPVISDSIRFKYPPDHAIRGPIPSPTNMSVPSVPLPSPTNLSSTSPIANTPLYGAFVSSQYPQFLRAKFPHAPHPPPPFPHAFPAHKSSVASAQFSKPRIFEESTSTDATPESSDVEDEGRSRKKRRGKLLMSDEEAARHSRHAMGFPKFLQELKAKLVSETTDGRVMETVAISALIQEFVKGNEDEPFTLPIECEVLLKQAAELVRERRERSKGLKKKKSSELIAAAAPGGHSSFVCPFCPEKVFKTQEGVVLHIRNKHEAEKPWKCLARDCDVTFVRQADLRMHLIRMHSRARPYPCRVPFCTKAFAGVSELRRHVKVDHRNIVNDLTGIENHDYM